MGSGEGQTVRGRKYSNNYLARWNAATLIHGFAPPPPLRALLSFQVVQRTEDMRVTTAEAGARAARAAGRLMKAKTGLVAARSEAAEAVRTGGGVL
jgi:hypothetical protein